jgi:D-aspartate ligase
MDLTLQSRRRPSVLLATAASGGTIAAVRHLSASGFKVGIISSTGARLSAAAWSRCAERAYTAPPENDSQHFVQRLMEIGAAEAGQILLPTSDQTAWMYTENAEALAQHYLTYQPSIQTLRRVLDKKLFADAAISAKVTVLPSWEPRTVDELVLLAPNLAYPILIKPRTHVHRIRNDKGVVVHSATELIQEFPQFVDREHLRTSESALLEDPGLPILQQFVRVSDEGVCSISGFIDRTGELFVTRRSTKVFQRSQPVGVGVCFESLPPDAELSNAVRRLCLELGYFGIFEVEFLKLGDGWAVIDFNPRFFNQLGLDIARGMPLPLFACLDAAGETDSLRAAVAKAQAYTDDSKFVFCDRFTLNAILTARSLTGRITRQELEYWRGWVKQHAAHRVDVAMDSSDPMPALIHVMSEIYLGLMAIPKFLRMTPRNASSPTARTLIQVKS